MNFLYERITYLFDPLHYLWEHEKMHRKISILLVLFFLGSLIGIELKRQGLLPHSLAQYIPGNHFYAVQASFTVVLILEVISLIFTLPCSFSRSVGKQFEILSLILMRNAFKELSQFPEPISFAGNQDAILHILSDGFGALLIFALLGLLLPDPVPHLGRGHAPYRSLQLCRRQKRYRPDPSGRLLQHGGQQCHRVL